MCLVNRRTKHGQGIVIPEDTKLLQQGGTTFRVAS